MNFAAHATIMNIKQTAMGVVLWVASWVVLTGGASSTTPTSPVQAPAPTSAPAPVGPNYEAGSAAYDAGDYDKARRIWQPLAEKGDVRAQRGMGKMYEKGRGRRGYLVAESRRQRAEARAEIPGQGLRRRPVRFAAQPGAGEVLV